MFDRQDIIEAHYAYCAEWHGGQWSPEYRRMCRISRYFTPGRLWKGADSLTENGRAIYDALTEGKGRYLIPRW